MYAFNSNTIKRIPFVYWIPRGLLVSPFIPDCRAYNIYLCLEYLCKYAPVTIEINFPEHCNF